VLAEGADHSGVGGVPGDPSPGLTSNPARPSHGGADRRTDARQSRVEAAGPGVAGATLDGQLGLPLSA
jgi:hypothetical protein